MGYDIMVAVRSLIFIGKVRKDPTTRVLIHEKSSLVPPGETMAFKLRDEEGFRWLGAYEISADDLLDGKKDFYRYLIFHLLSASV